LSGPVIVGPVTVGCQAKFTGSFPAQYIFVCNRWIRSATIDSWGHMLYRFSEPIEVRAGDRVRLMAQHNRDVLLIWDLRDSA
jgi:hypothetical protein